jgi:hypothetical protein
MPYHAIPCHTMPYHIIPCHATIPYHTVPYFIIPCHVAPTIRYHTIDAGDGHDGGYVRWLGQCEGFARAGITLTALHIRALKALHFWVNDGTYSVGYLPPATYSCPLPAQAWGQRAQEIMLITGICGSCAGVFESKRATPVAWKWRPVFEPFPGSCRAGQNPQNRWPHREDEQHRDEHSPAPFLSGRSSPSPHQLIHLLNRRLRHGTERWGGLPAELPWREAGCTSST